MQFIEWSPEDVPLRGRGWEGGLIRRHFNLSALHGEREYLRHGFFVDVDADGRKEIITRTQNDNRARCIRSEDGSTVWVSPRVTASPEEAVQISDIAVGDLDEDGVPEVLLASYFGDVICLSALDGSIKWHRRLDWIINNSMLAARRITDSPGKNIALTVAHEGKPAGPPPRYRFNHMFEPSLLILDAEGRDEVLVENYAEHNSAGHYTWTYDIDEDGFCEVACCGDHEIIWFDGEGNRLFALPSPGEGGHPDDVRVFNWRPDLPGKEIIYLNGTVGINMYSSRGEALKSVAFGRDVASHLQLICPFRQPEGPRLLASNIRAADSRLLLLDQDLSVQWSLAMAGT